MPGWNRKYAKHEHPTNRCQYRAGNSQRLDVLRAWKKETPDRAEVKPSRCNINGRHSGRASRNPVIDAIHLFTSAEVYWVRSGLAWPGRRFVWDSAAAKRHVCINFTGTRL